MSNPEKPPATFARRLEQAKRLREHRQAEDAEQAIAKREQAHHNQREEFRGLLRAALNIDPDAVTIEEQEQEQDNGTNDLRLSVTEGEFRLGYSQYRGTGSLYLAGRCPACQEGYGHLGRLESHAALEYNLLLVGDYLQRRPGKCAACYSREEDAQPLQTPNARALTPEERLVAALRELIAEKTDRLGEILEERASSHLQRHHSG